MQHTDSAGTERGHLARSSDGDERRGAVSPMRKRCVGNDPIEMLQIFVRPEAADMEPGVQFVSLDKTRSIDHWRLLAGPR